jgi:hypothetical protein
MVRWQLTVTDEEHVIAVEAWLRRTAKDQPARPSRTPKPTPAAPADRIPVPRRATQRPAKPEGARVRPEDPARTIAPIVEMDAERAGNRNN